MLASVFWFDGMDALCSPDDHVERFRKIEPALEKMGFPPVLTSDARKLSRVAGLVTVLCASGLALGKYPRLCALALTGLNFPISVVNNPVWMARDKAERDCYARGLVMGASLAGGLMMTVANAGGGCSRMVRREIRKARRLESAK